MGKGSLKTRADPTVHRSDTTADMPAVPQDFRALTPPRTAGIGERLLPREEGLGNMLKTPREIFSQDFLSKHKDNILFTTRGDQTVITVMTSNEEGVLLNAKNISEELEVRGLTLIEDEIKEGKTNLVTRFKIEDSDGNEQNIRLVLVTRKEPEINALKPVWVPDKIDIGGGRVVEVSTHKMPGGTTAGKVMTSPFVYVLGDEGAINELFIYKTLTYYEADLKRERTPAEQIPKLLAEKEAKLRGDGKHLVCAYFDAHEKRMYVLKGASQESSGEFNDLDNVIIALSNLVHERVHLKKGTQAEAEAIMEQNDYLLKTSKGTLAIEIDGDSLRIVKRNQTSQRTPLDPQIVARYVMPAYAEDHPALAASRRGIRADPFNGDNQAAIGDSIAADSPYAPISRSGEPRVFGEDPRNQIDTRVWQKAVDAAYLAKDQKRLNLLQNVMPKIIPSEEAVRQLLDNAISARIIGDVQAITKQFPSVKPTLSKVQEALNALVLNCQPGGNNQNHMSDITLLQKFGVRPTPAAMDKKYTEILSPRDVTNIDIPLLTKLIEISGVKPSNELIQQTYLRIIRNVTLSNLTDSTNCAQQLYKATGVAMQSSPGLSIPQFATKIATVTGFVPASDVQPTKAPNNPTHENDTKVPTAKQPNHFGADGSTRPQSAQVGENSDQARGQISLLRNRAGRASPNPSHPGSTELIEPANPASEDIVAQRIATLFERRPPFSTISTLCEEITKITQAAPESKLSPTILRSLLNRNALHNVDEMFSLLRRFQDMIPKEQDDIDRAYVFIRSQSDRSYIANALEFSDIARPPIRPSEAELHQGYRKILGVGVFLDAQIDNFAEKLGHPSSQTLKKLDQEFTINTNTQVRLDKAVAHSNIIQRLSRENWEQVCAARTDSEKVELNRKLLEVIRTRAFNYDSAREELTAHETSFGIQFTSQLVEDEIRSYYADWMKQAKLNGVRPTNIIQIGTMKRLTGVSLNFSAADVDDIFMGMISNGSPDADHINAVRELTEIAFNATRLKPRVEGIYASKIRAGKIRDIIAIEDACQIPFDAKKHQIELAKLCREDLSERITHGITSETQILFHIVAERWGLTFSIPPAQAQIMYLNAMNRTADLTTAFHARQTDLLAAIHKHSNSLPDKRIATYAYQTLLATINADRGTDFETRLAALTPYLTLTEEGKRELVQKAYDTLLRAEADSDGDNNGYSEKIDKLGRTTLITPNYSYKFQCEVHENLLTKCNKERIDAKIDKIEELTKRELLAEDRRRLAINALVKRAANKEVLSSLLSDKHGFTENINTDQFPLALRSLIKTFSLDTKDRLVDFIDKQKDLIAFVCGSPEIETKITLENAKAAKKLGIPLISAERLLRAGFNLNQCAASMDYEELFERLSQVETEWQDESNIAGPFRCGTEVFGWKRMFEYVQGQDLHNSLFQFKMVIQAQRTSGLPPNQFYHNILSQVHKDASTYDAGRAYDHLNTIVSSANFDVNSVFTKARELDLPELNTLLNSMGSPSRVFSSWNSLKQYYELSDLLSRTGLLKELSELKGEPTKQNLYRWVSTLLLRPGGRVSPAEVEKFWRRPHEFLGANDAHASADIHNNIKPSNYTSIPHLDLTAVELRDALVNGTLNSLQELPPFEVTYTLPIESKSTNALIRQALGSKTENIQGEAINSGKLFTELNAVLKPHSMNINKLLEGQAPLTPAIEQSLLAQIANADYGAPQLFQKYRAKVNLKSDPDAVVAGNDTACCMWFGSGKNTVYMFNPNAALFTLQIENGDGKWKTIAQSLLTTDKDVGVLVHELMESFDLEQGRWAEKVSKEKLREAPGYLACDNVETNPNYLDKKSTIKSLYADFFADYLRRYKQHLNLEDKFLPVGMANSKAFDTLPTVPNTFTPKAPVSYLDKEGRKVYSLKPKPIEGPVIRQVELPERKSKVDRSTQTKGVSFLSPNDILPTAYLKQQVYSITNSSMIQGLHTVENVLIAAGINNQLKGRPDMSLKCTDDNGVLKGYLIAYEGNLNNTSPTNKQNELTGKHQPVLYIEDFAVDGFDSIGGGKTATKIVEEFLNQYKSQYIDKQNPIPILGHFTEKTSYKLIQNRLEEFSRKLGVQFEIEELDQRKSDNNTIYTLLIKPVENK